MNTRTGQQRVGWNGQVSWAVSCYPSETLLYARVAVYLASLLEALRLALKIYIYIRIVCSSLVYSRLLSVFPTYIRKPIRKFPLALAWSFLWYFLSSALLSSALDLPTHIRQPICWFRLALVCSCLLSSCLLAPTVDFSNISPVANPENSGCSRLLKQKKLWYRDQRRAYNYLWIDCFLLVDHLHYSHWFNFSPPASCRGLANRIY